MTTINTHYNNNTSNNNNKKDDNNDLRNNKTAMAETNDSSVVVIDAAPTATLAAATPSAFSDSKSSPTSSSYNELSENFYINKNKQNVKIQVKLNRDGIYLRRETSQQNHINEQLIRITDIIGSYCGPRLKKRARGGLSSCKRLSSDDEQRDPTVPPARSNSGTNNNNVNKNNNVNSNKNNSRGTSSNNNNIDTLRDTSAYLYVYAYLKEEKPFRRVRTVRILHFRSYETFAENYHIAELWHRGIINNKFAGKKRTIMDPAGNKQMLIFLNPKSGSGKGREMFQKQVTPILKEAEIQYELHVTTHANYATEFLRTCKDLLQCYNGIVVAAGDGLFYEVLNGVMQRSDWREVTRQMPLGIIPCGSGNGLAKSIAHVYNEPYEPKPILNSTLTCVSGNTALMDIVHVELSKGDQHKDMYSFLSVGWGLIADIDIESERLRSIGAQRFTLWSILRLITLRSYKGKVSYLPWTKELAIHHGDNIVRNDTATSTIEPNTQPSTASAKRTSRRSLDQEFHDFPDDLTVDDINFNPNINNSGGDDDDEEFADAISRERIRTESFHSAISRHTAYYSIAGHSMHSQRSSIAASITRKIEAANSELNIYTPPTSSIPPINMPLPTDTWQCEEGEFVMVQAAYTTHLASDCLFAPDSQLDDGIIYLVIIRAGVSRSHLMQFLLSLSSGTHLPVAPHDFIRVVPVRAFRIEPTGDEGIITVDGERVDYGNVQGEILPGMINVMVPREKNSIS